MSIIFDALKKVEKSQGEGAQEPAPGNGKSKIVKYIVLVVVVFIGVYAGKMLFSALAPKVQSMFASTQQKPGSKKEVSSKTAAKTPLAPLAFKNVLSKDSKAAPAQAAQKQPLKKTSSQPYELNGVFTSGDETFALVNNEIVREGDSIEEATVVSVALDEVQLRVKGKIITLHTYGQ